MSEFVEVASLEDIPVGTKKAVEVGGRMIAVFCTEAGVFATDNACPHRGGPLAEGDLLGKEITCPWHFWTFDLETGCHADPRVQLVTHEVRVEGSTILVRLTERNDAMRGIV